MLKKFYPLASLAEKIDPLRGHETLVLTNGCFDLLHVGHVRYLQAARAQGGCLIVGLNTDLSVQAIKGPSRPLNREEDRAEVLAALSCVDFVTLFAEPTADHLIEIVKPDLYVKAGDYTLDTLPERETLLRLAVKVAFMPFFAGHSTSSLIAKAQG